MNAWSPIIFIVGVALEFLLSYIIEQSRLIAIIVIVLSIVILVVCYFLHKRYPKLFGEKCSQAVMAIVFNTDYSKTVLVYNKRQQYFLPPGGHAGKGSKLHELAKAKVKDETGLDGEFILQKFHEYNDDTCITVPQPFAVQLEKQEAHEGHLQHYDFIYLMTADENAPLSIDHQAKWYTLNEVEQLANHRDTYTDVYKVISSAKVMLENKLLAIGEASIDDEICDNHLSNK